MTRTRLWLYDTTLRDGQQTQGVQFSTAEKVQIAQALDALGVDYIEGGWPGANPTDSAFFEDAPETRATFTAFGMTKRAGRSAANDEVLAAVLNAGTRAVCLVGKTHDYHVERALGITLDENTANIGASIAHVVAQGREALFDAEHFFDGYKANPGYALEACQAALEAGARWVVLCDTNGGALPAEVGRIVAEVIAAGIPGDRLGIHTHNDTENAVANTLAAIDAGARQVQGTLNGLGERCGNANLTSLIPTLLLKEPYAGRFETGVTRDALQRLTRTSRMLDDILNRVPMKQAPYVGASAFAHKAGLHASAILKDPATYEHVAPETVGNKRIIPMSNQAGQSNLRQRLAEAGLETRADDPALGAILEEIKAREDQGYSYDTAQASFELLARRALGRLPEFFEVKRYKVTVERRKNKYDRMVSLSEAVVVVKVDGEKKLSVSESMDAAGSDRGPVNALAKALAKDLGRYSEVLEDMRLVDFKVRITQGGTEAVTRVIIDSEDGQGRHWSTVGVSANIVDASFEALLDAITWKLVRDCGAAA
ncbi:MAG: citramalate synthase [Sedimentitalea sp.]|nr:citramalate synthase [Sedimentitalea sp.]